MQTELYGLMTSDPEAGKQRMVEIAAAQGVTLTTEEVRGLLQMDEEEEFDDIELDAVALAAIVLVDAEVFMATVAKRKRMTNHGGVALACVRCASGYSVGSLPRSLITDSTSCSLCCKAVNSVVYNACLQSGKVGGLHKVCFID